jgi:formamidopyrimidine-DNA glycosylase
MDACFSDPRKFGKICLCHSDDEFQSLAPDGLDEFTDVTPLIGQSMGVKAILLDQKRAVSGVGNWVADEVLYRSEIHPDQTFLTEAQAVSIQAALHDILAVAVDCLDSGKNYPRDWLFHYRWSKGKDGAQDAKGRAIKFITSAGRTSAVVASIQKKRAKQPTQLQKWKRRTVGANAGEKAFFESNVRKRKATFELTKAPCIQEDQPLNDRRLRSRSNDSHALSIGLTTANPI